MKINKSEIGIVTGLLTFIIIKVIFSGIGIENIPAPLIITIFVVSYIMFIVGASKNLIRKEKVYFILCSSFIAISIIACIAVVILLNYFRPIVIENGAILIVLSAVAMISLTCAGVLAVIIKKMRG